VSLLCSKAEGNDCSTDVTGLCTPGVTEIIEETITEETTYDSTGQTTITTTVTDTTTTTVTNEDSGNILDGSNGYVSSSKEGDMDVDWGGQGPASMPSGNSCGQLGTDKCAMITGSGNSTSTMGVSGMGTTFYQTINISDLEIDRGGETNYTIKVNKSDPQDRIYMHITGKDGNTQKFAGTDILSETGVTTGYQEYSGGFDFSGGLTTLIVEVGGRDINLAVGPMFDDVTINVLYNVVNTIVTQQITTVEMFIALNMDVTEEIIDVVETIFDNNDINNDNGFSFEPIEQQQEEFSYETVEMEMEIEFENFTVEMPVEIDMPMDMSGNIEAPMEIQVANLEMEMEMEMDLPMPEPVEPETIEVAAVEEPAMNDEVETNEQPEEVKESQPEETTEDIEEVQEEPKEEIKEVKEEPKEEPKAEPKKEIKKVVAKKEDKQKAANKIVKKMGDKGRYDSGNQLKTLVVMQVLGNSKDFFSTQQNLPDIEGFFTDTKLPDSSLKTNNIGQYFLFGSSNSTHNALVDMQYK
tara:strand:- start:247 stop:1818 length:1572 start_codon:yes stop_codon:yes gene_type:complete